MYIELPVPASIEACDIEKVFHEERKIFHFFMNRVLFVFCFFLVS